MVDIVDPEKPLGAGTGIGRTLPVSSKETPVLTVDATVHEEAVSLVRIIRGELDTLEIEIASLRRETRKKVDTHLDRLAVLLGVD